MQTKTRTSKAGPAIFVVFGSIFSLAGVVGLWFLGVKPVLQVVMAQAWESVPCVVVSSDVEESSSSDGSTYRVAIAYRYDVGGRTYQGDRYNFSTGYSSGYKGKKDIVDQYPVGFETSAYVNPRDPTQSVLNRSPGWYLLLGLFFVPFLAVGMGAIVFALRRRRGGITRRSTAHVVRPVPGGTGSEPGHNERVLRPGMTRVTKLVALAFFGVLWNAFVWGILVFAVLPDYRRGGAGVWTLLFFTPFVLVGLGLVLGAVHQLLALGNPRPILELGQTVLYPGVRTTLSWKVEGQVYKLKSLTITLSARETVRYRRGTSTYTDHHEFFKTDVYSSRMPEDFRSASVNLEIPSGTMPTFTAPNNKIEWRLKVRGDIPHWPDVNAEFPLIVSPDGGNA